MTDYARRTYARNDNGPRVLDPRVNRRAPESPTRRRREPAALNLALEMRANRLPPKIESGTSISMQFVITSRIPSQLRHINPQSLVAVASLIDSATGGPASPGSLTSMSTSARARPVQPVGPTFETLFQDLSIRKPGTFRIKVSLLRMPEGSEVGGHATHVAAWESDNVRVRSVSNRA